MSGPATGFAGGDGGSLEAELVAIGSELLLPGFLDTNSQWLAARLEAAGIPVRLIALVGDDERRIAAIVASSLRRSGAIIVTGGLGPTEDDRTRAAIARALGLDLEHDEKMDVLLSEKIRSRGRVPEPSHSRQADRPRGADWIENPVGIAPGFVVRGADAVLFALPGVPAEMRPMFEASVLPGLRSRVRGGMLRRTLKVAGRTESSVDRAIADLYASTGVELTILARTSGIELVLRAKGPSGQEALARLNDLDREITRRLGEDVFGRDDDTLAAVVGNSLREASAVVATAESCTAGLLAATLTEVPGSSAWFRGGVVAYANDLKTALAGVRTETLARHGAVSAEVAREMAMGIRSRCVAEYGVGITGIAGPEGGTTDKPVGLVHVAVADSTGVEEVRWTVPGDRDLVRKRTVTLALDRLRRRIRRRS